MGIKVEAFSSFLVFTNEVKMFVVFFTTVFASVSAFIKNNDNSFTMNRDIFNLLLSIVVDERVR